MSPLEKQVHNTMIQHNMSQPFSLLFMQPYVDEFKKNREKFKKEMIIDDNEEHKIMQNEKEERNMAPTSVCNSEYYQVTSQPEPDNNNYTTLNNNAAIGLAFNVTEKFPKDSVLLFGL
ncbi:hypothetical protein HN873_062980 [Arachis hypogaea]